MTAAGQTGQTAHVLLSACSSCPTFLICLFIVANYSSILEPVAQMLQSVQLDIVKAQQHISSLINIIKNHRDHAEEHFRDDILSKARPLADKLGIELVLPRICSWQTYRANSAGMDFEIYYRTRLYIPYLDSLVSSLVSRFSSNNNAQFNLFYLHPKTMQELEREEFRSLLAVSNALYRINNLEYETMNWFDYWRSQSQVADVAKLETADLLKHCDFFPAVKEAILIVLTLSATTCSIERSFSTLRLVKTWLRSTMSHERLSTVHDKRSSPGRQSRQEALHQ